MPAGSSPRPRGLRVAEALAWTIGLLLIGTYFAIRTHQASVAKERLRRFEQQRARLATPATPVATPAPMPEALRTLSWGTPDQLLWSHERMKAWTLASSVPAAEAPLAVLKIPKINLEVPVLEGTDDPALDYGAGHIAGTALPGQAGNIGIAGHRDGFFRGLKDIVPGDAIDLETARGSEAFVVENIWLVDPDDVWVLDDTPAEALTLVTCYPFYFVGSAPRRYIVRATRAPSAPG
jgi:sortase A